MMRIWRLIFLVYVVLFATACYQSIRTVGTIEIDADKPVVHDGLLPVGLTLGGKSISGKDLLSHNLLINGGFELAPRLENCKYDFNTQEITTPNGYTTVYPVPEIHFGWKILHGLSAVQRAEDGASSLYHISLIPARDSLNSVEIINTARFSVLSRDAYTFSARMKASSDSLYISIVLVDSALVELSEAQKVHLSSQTWERVMATVSPNKSSDVAHMMIRVKGRGSVSIDDITFTPSDMKLTHNLSDSLFYLIRDFGAGFIRFPEGRVANGFFPGTYPRWARETDTSSKFPFWTISGHEYTGDFGLDDFLLLSKLLRLPPILVSNIGMTDRTAAPRAENIKFLGDRISAHLELGKHILSIYDISKDSAHLMPAIQMGYDMTSYDYFRRFSAMSEAFWENHVPIDLISSGDLRVHQRFSDRIFDASCKPVKSPILSDLVPDINDNISMLKQPIMLGECRFSRVESTLFIPNLILRASFLVNAENLASNLKGLTISPLLAERGDTEAYPLVYVDGGRYIPTPLYSMMKAYLAMRGPLLRSLNDCASEDLSGWKPIYTSLTSTADNKTFYLKVVNTTRHPLPYRFVFKGKNFSPLEVRGVHFLTEGKTTTTNLKDFDKYIKKTQTLKLNTTAKDWVYTIQPYEIVFFEFHSK